MSSKKKKETKKEKKKKLELQETEKKEEDKDDLKKNNIFSKIDMIDSVTKEESRVMEARLRKGLLESENIEKDEKIGEAKTNISDIKKQIENLRELKQKHYNEQDYDKAIEFSEIIINMAMKNNLKLIINEEKNYINDIQNQIGSKESLSDQIESLKKKKQHYYINEEYKEAIQIATKIIDLAKQLNLNSTMREEEKFIDLLQDKISQESSRMKIVEKIENIRVIDHNKVVKDTIIEDMGIELKNPENEEKDKLFAKIRKLEEELTNLRKEKQELEEAKEAFEWEKKMFEEVKQFEREKIEDEISQKARIESESQEKENLREDKLKFEKEKEIYWHERHKLEEAMKVFDRRKQQFEEEKKAFEWEKQMFEEAKHFERDKEK